MSGVLAFPSLVFFLPFHAVLMGHAEAGGTELETFHLSGDPETLADLSQPVSSLLLCSCLRVLSSIFGALSYVLCEDLGCACLFSSVTQRCSEICTVEYMNKAALPCCAVKLSCYYSLKFFLTLTRGPCCPCTKCKGPLGLGWFPELLKKRGRAGFFPPGKSFFCKSHPDTAKLFWIS